MGGVCYVAISGSSEREESIRSDRGADHRWARSGGKICVVGRVWVCVIGFVGDGIWIVVRVGVGI